jgi:segregation and condensation protein A
MVSPAQRAIAILIDLAEQGEIDPWDVQVVEVIDRFLAEIQFNPVLPEVGWETTPYEANLSESGQAFLYASMLVLLKADTLARIELARLESEIEAEEDFPEDLPDNVIPLPRNLERRLRRRAVAHPPVQRPVSLGELIEQLELMAEVLEAPPRRPKPRRPKPATEKQATQAINQLSHHENPAALANPIGEFLEHQWLRLAGGKEWLDFEDLVQAWQHHHSRDAESPMAADRVGVFWALLLLSAQSKVELEQVALYQPLKIRLLAQTAEVLDVLPTPAVS